MLRSLESLDNKIERLKDLVRDEEDKNNIVLSDTEFDDASVDPRYESSKYKSVHNTKREHTPPAPSKKGHVPGLIKNHRMTSTTSADAIKREELQRKRMEKQLQADSARKKALEGSDELSSLFNTLQNVKQLTKEQERQERLRHEKMKSAPVKSGFMAFEDPNFLQVVESNKYKSSDDYRPENDPGFDSFSHMYINARYIPEKVLKDQLNDTLIFRLSKLYQMIPSRIGELMEANLVVVGAIKQRSKSSISDRGKKYVKLVLSDFKFDIVVYLWGDAYERFWKIRPGSICAILNPEIKQMPTKNGHSKTYMLRLESGLSILEYARFAHFAICRGLKGHPCSEAIDSRKSNYCSYHLEKSADKNASNRNEMGSNYKLFTPVDRDGNKQVLMVNDSELERLELEGDAKEAKKNSYNGLAIANVKPNRPKNNNRGIMVTDLNNPDTQVNLQSKEEVYSKQFKSHEAYASFLDKGVNKAELIEQERRHELDLKLKKEMIERDENLKRKHDKELQNMSYKKLKQQEFKERKKELLVASKTKKSLRKDKSLINKIQADHAKVDEEIKTRKKCDNIKHSSVEINVGLNNDVQLSSDDDSESDLEIE